MNIVRKGLARRERTGSEKRRIGFANIKRMLPRFPHIEHDGDLPDSVFAPELVLMSMEDSYCDMWGRTDIIDARTRSLFTVGMMIAVGNVGNQFELGWHGPCAIYNGVTIDELEAIVVHARAYVGSPASAWATQSIIAALKDHGLLEEPRPAADIDRRERRGSEKRKIARETLHALDPAAQLLDLRDEIEDGTFAAELDLMVLENVYFDLWTRTDILDHRARSIVTLGMLIGLDNHSALAAHVAVARRSGITVAELEEFVLQAATYLGYPAGIAIRETIGTSLVAITGIDTHPPTRDEVSGVQQGE